MASQEIPPLDITPNPTSTLRPSSPSTVSKTSEELNAVPSGDLNQGTFHHPDTARSKGEYAIVPTQESAGEKPGEHWPSQQQRVSATYPGEIPTGQAQYDAPSKFSILWQWRFEVSALCASILAFLAMIIFLRAHDGKPQPEWDTINVNTLVAIFTMLLRAAMLFIIAEVIGQAKWLWMSTPRPLRHIEYFDNAGRGALGSIRFLFLTWKPVLTVLGALIVITSYAVGPFAQQAVKTFACEISSAGVARISVANWVGQVDSNEPVGTRTMSYSWLSPTMRTIAINGLLGSSQNSPQDLFQCDSSNCTFRETMNVTHSSVGICSKCLDVRSELQEYPDLWDLTEYGMGIVDNNGSVYKFHNDSGFSINSRYRPKALNMESQKTDDYDTWTFDFKSGTPRTSILTLSTAGCSLRGNGSFLEDGLPNRVCPNRHDNTPALHLGVDIVAANCSLHPCLRHYRGSILNGVLKESLLTTSPMMRANMSQAARPIKRLKPNQYVAIMEPCIVDNIWYYSSNISQAPRNGIDWASWTSRNASYEAPTSCLRYLDAQVFFGLQSFLFNEMVGHCQAIILGEGSITTVAPDLLGCTGGWWVETLHNGGNATFDIISAAFDDMATAITNRMRTYGQTWAQASRSYAEGSSSRTSVCIRMDWPWLLYPAGLLALTSTLLATAVVQSCRDRGKRPVWKSRILPLVFYGISRDEAQNLRHDTPVVEGVPLLQLAEIEKLADKTVARFCSDRQRIGFVVEGHAAPN